jgi:hypothetical protein
MNARQVIIVVGVAVLACGAPIIEPPIASAQGQSRDPISGSGTALVMEVARVLSGADVETDRSIRFAL